MQIVALDCLCRQADWAVLFLLWLLSAGWQLTCTRVTGLVWGRKQNSHLGPWQTLDPTGRSLSAMAPHMPCTTPMYFITLNHFSLPSCWGLLLQLIYIGRQLRDVKQKELQLLMTGCRMCCGKPYCILFGHPVDIFDRVIVGNHGNSLRRRSNFQIQCITQY